MTQPNLSLCYDHSQLMQYGSRFLAWWLSARDPDLSQRAFKLYRTTQRSRKAFRMLKARNTTLQYYLHRDIIES